MLALLWRTRVVSAFRRTRFLPWPIIVVVLGTLFARMSSLRGRTLPLLERTLLRAVRLAIAGSRADFEFVQLVPFRVRAVTFRNGVELANPAAQIDGLRIIHGRYYGPVWTHRSTSIDDVRQVIVDVLAASHALSAL